MTKVILKADQSYIDINGNIKFGKKDSLINVDNTFLPLIRGKYELPSEKKEEPIKPDKPTKPVDKMNKTELVEFIKGLDIDMTDEELEQKTKAQLVKLINEQ